VALVVELLVGKTSTAYLVKAAQSAHLHPMRDILFDEKIAGSFISHPDKLTKKRTTETESQVHWDMVSIQRPDYGGGEIYFDGKLIRKNGVFLPKQLRSLNWPLIDYEGLVWLG